MALARTAGYGNTHATVKALWLGQTKPDSRVAEVLWRAGIEARTPEHASGSPVPRIGWVERAPQGTREAPRLEGYRIAVLHHDAGGSDALAEALRAQGAAVAVMGRSHASMKRARMLEPDAVLTTPADVTNHSHAVLLGLWEDPVLRWTPVLVVPPERLGGGGVHAPNLRDVGHALAETTRTHRHLEQHAAAQHELTLAVTELGPVRTLRTLVGMNTPLRVEVSHGDERYELDLVEQIVAGARAWRKEEQEPSALGVNALAGVLSLTEGMLRVRHVEHPAATNIMAPLDVAITGAFPGGEHPLPDDPDGHPGRSPLATRPIPQVVSDEGQTAYEDEDDPPTGVFDHNNMPALTGALAREGSPANDATAEPAGRTPKGTLRGVSPGLPQSEIQALTGAARQAERAREEDPSAQGSAPPQAQLQDHVSAAPTPAPVSAPAPKQQSGLPALGGLPKVPSIPSTGRAQRSSAPESLHLGAQTGWRPQANTRPLSVGDHERRASTPPSGTPDPRDTAPAPVDSDASQSGENAQLAVPLPNAKEPVALEPELSVPPSLDGPPPSATARTERAEPLPRAVEEEPATAPAAAVVAALTERAEELRRGCAERLQQLPLHRFTRQPRLAAGAAALCAGLLIWALWPEGSAAPTNETLAAAAEPGLPAEVAAAPRPPAPPPPPVPPAPQADPGKPQGERAAVTPAAAEAKGQVADPAEADAEPTEPAEPVESADPEADAEEEERRVQEEDDDEAEDEDEDDGDDARRARLQRARAMAKQAYGLYRAGRLQEAKRLYLRSLRARRAYPRALSGLTRVHLATRNYRAARRTARSLVRLRPGQGVYHLFLGDAYLGLRKMGAAKKAWRRAARRGTRAAKKRLRRYR